MPKHKDNSIISSYFQSSKSPTGDDVYNEGMMMVLGQIEKIHYVDDATNISKQFVEYDVSVRDAKGGQSKLRNVRCATVLGGTNDSDEIILEQNSYSFLGKLDPSNFFLNKNGTTVVIAFLNGNKDKPFIIAAMQHPRKRGAKRADGIRRKGEFRGITWEINKDGEFILTYLGNKSSDGKQQREDTSPTYIKIDKTGALTISDNEQQLIKMDRVDKSIKIVTKENYIIEVGKDLTVTINGNETVTTTGDRVHSAANHTLTGGGNIKIGSESSSENLVLGQKFLTLYNAHTHIGNLGLPTGVPTTPMSSNELSQKNFTE